jgi:hypothetical protein
MCLWFFYQFCKCYGRAPLDWLDLCDGLHMMSIENDVTRIYSED